MKVGRFCVEPGLSSPKIVKFLPALPILLGDVLFSMEPAYVGRAFCLSALIFMVVSKTERPALDRPLKVERKHSASCGQRPHPANRALVARYCIQSQVKVKSAFQSFDCSLPL
jgi:hypothetical protein